LAAQTENLFVMTRSATLIAMSIAIVAQAFSMRTKPAPLLLWNASASVPIGFYSVEPIDQLAVTNLIVAMPPNSLATFLAERGYVPLGVPLIKRILALPGQSVCRNELVISVDGIAMGVALAHDQRGQPLPIWQGCRAIAQGEVFLMNWDEPASFDGRYFGLMPLRAIIGRAQPLWTLDKP
jgi:conjugative transfer signal peptidase TraF